MPLLFVVLGILLLLGIGRFFANRDAKDIILFLKVLGTLTVASAWVFLLFTGRWVIAFLVLLVLFPFVPRLKKSLKKTTPPPLLPEPTNRRHPTKGDQNKKNKRRERHKDSH